jgi:hypothetical protein
MRYRYIIPLLLSCLFYSCKKDKTVTAPPPQPPIVVTPLPPAPPPQLLKDMVLSNLPSPFYHFEYDSRNKPIFVSFAAGLAMYDILYFRDRISEMRNTIPVNKDRLVYSYNIIGKPDTVRYIDSAGFFYKRCHFAYNGSLVTRITWERWTGRLFVPDRTLTLLYYGDGNVREIVDHRLPVNRQNELTIREQFSQYDDKVNTDGFALIHDENNDHLVLLPGVQFQKNNPGKVLHTGDGADYEAVYTYTYNIKNAPLTKQGQITFLTGSSTGQQFQTNTTLTYY